MTTIITNTESEFVPPLCSQVVEVTETPSNACSNTKWGAILAGSFTAAASWTVLYLFGMGVGLTAIEPNNPSSLRAIGVGAGIWSLACPVIALFGGGWVASRLAPNPNRLNRAIQAGVVWSVTSLAAMSMLFMLASNVVGGAVSAGTQVAGAVASTAGNIDQGTLSSLGINANDLLQPINQRLRANGEPEVTAAQLEAAVRDVLRTAVRTGDIDRQTVAMALVNNTALTAREANQIATTIAIRWQQVRERGTAFANRASRATLRAAEATGEALLGLSIAMILALGSSVGGSLLPGALAARRARKAMAPAVK